MLVKYDTKQIIISAVALHKQGKSFTIKASGEIIADAGVLENTETRKVLLKAIQGELKAHLRYSAFAEVAREEGYEQIANIFSETSRNEKEHAKRLAKYLNIPLDMVHIDLKETPIGTKKNLATSISNEGHEVREMYPDFANIAEKEGFIEIANKFRMLVKVEAEHKRRYLKLLQNISTDHVFIKDGKVWWKCLNCGFVYESDKALDPCPVCEHPIAFMQVREENY